MSLNVEHVESILRIFRGFDGADELAPFDATGTVHYHGDVVVAYGFHGALKAKDIFDIYAHCKESGARWLLAHRQEGRTIPCGRLMPDGFPFGGWWRVDLHDIKRLND